MGNEEKRDWKNEPMSSSFTIIDLDRTFTKYEIPLIVNRTMIKDENE